MNVRLLSIVLLLSFLVFIVELVRRERLTFKYAAGWILVSVLGVFLALCDQFLASVAVFFGFHLTSNFVFFAVCGGLVFLSLLLTIFLCQQNLRNDRMSQKIGLLQLELERLKQKTRTDDANTAR